MLTPLSAQTAHFSGAQMEVGEGLLHPQGMTADAAGNLYIADSDNDRILKETLVHGNYVQTVAVDGLPGPVVDVAVDASGTLYFNEWDNGVIRKAVPAGISYSLSRITTSPLENPSGIAVDSRGNVYISDSGHNRVLKESPIGAGYVESTVASTGLGWPSGVAIDASGSVLIADEDNSRILKETPTATGYIETTLISSGLQGPTRMALGANGSLYVADYFANTVVKETLSGSAYSQSVVVSSPLSHPLGVAVGQAGNLFIADYQNDRVLAIAETKAQFGEVSIGAAGVPRSLFFTFDAPARLGESPAVFTQGAAGLDFSDAGTGSCRAGVSYGTGESCSVIVGFKPLYAGTRYGGVSLTDNSGEVLAAGFLQGTGLGPQAAFLPGAMTTILADLNLPRAISTDAVGGNIYIADTDNMRVLRLPLAGGSSAPTVVNQSALQWPSGVAVDGAGNVYIDDTYHSRVLKETPFGDGYRESVMVSKGLNYPEGIAVDGAGNVYIADSGSNRILMEVPSAAGYTTAALPIEGLNNPQGVFVDGNGDVYIADSGNNRVVEAVYSGSTYTVTVIPTTTQLSFPKQIAVDGSGAVYIADTKNNRIIEESLVSGSYGESVLATGLSAPNALTLDQRGNLFIANTEAGAVVEVDLADAPNLSFTATDTARTVDLRNIGNQPLLFPTPASGNNPAVSPHFTLDEYAPRACTQVSASQAAGPGLAPADSCVLAVRFDSAGVVSVTGDLVINTDDRNDAATMHDIRLAAVGSATQTALTLTILGPKSATFGSSILLGFSVLGPATHSSIQGGSISLSDASGLIGRFAVGADGAASTTYLAAKLGMQALYAEYMPTVTGDSSATGTLTLDVTAAQLDLYAADATRIYGSPNPRFVGSIQGAGAGLAEQFTTAANQGSPVGTYAITPSLTGGVAAGYAVSVHNGTLRVTAAPLSVTAANASRQFGSADPVFTGTMAGAVNGDSIQASYTAAATRDTAPGRYPIFVSVSGAVGNYTVAVVAGTLTITKADTQVTLTQGAGPLSLQAQVSSAAGVPVTGTVRFLNGATVLGEVTLANGSAVFAMDASPAGPITAVYGGDTNFLGATSDPLTVQATSTAFSFGVMDGSATQTASASGAAAFLFQATPGNAGLYPGTASFSVTGLPAGATATFSPATLPADRGAQVVTMTVQLKNGSTTGVIGGLNRVVGGVALATMMLPFAGRMRKRRRGFVAALLLTISGTVLLTGCGVTATRKAVDPTATKTPTGAAQATAYPLTVTMTSGGTTRIAAVTLIAGQ